MSEERIVLPIEPGAAALRELIETDYKNAMRARDQRVIGTLRLLRASVQALTVARTDAKRPDFGRPLTEADVISVIEKEIKQHEESAEGYDKVASPDRAAEERAQADLLRCYLPAKMDREAIAAVVQRLVAELGPDFRKVMPAAAKELKGKADGRFIQEVVKEATG